MKNKRNRTIIFAFILFPVFINAFLIAMNLINKATGLNLSASMLGNAEWLTFWGAFIGGFATLIAFIGMWEQNQEVMQQNQETLDFQVRSKKAEISDHKLDNIKTSVVNAIREIDTGAFSKILSSATTVPIKEQQLYMLNIKDKLYSAQIELEIMTVVSNDFSRCDLCVNNPCVVKHVFQGFQNQYYAVISQYLDAIALYEKYLTDAHSNELKTNLINNLTRQEFLLDSQIKSIDDQLWRASQSLNNGYINTEDLKIQKGKYMLELEICLKEKAGNKSELIDQDVVMQPLNEAIPIINKLINEDKRKLVWISKQYIQVRENRIIDTIENVENKCVFVKKEQEGFNE